MAHFPYAWAFSEDEPKETVTALAQVRRHAEVRALRGEIAELKALLRRSPR